MRYTIRSIHMAQQRPDTPADVAERIRSRAIGDQVWREFRERYPVLDASNAKEAAAWQMRRLDELQRALVVSR